VLAAAVMVGVVSGGGAAGLRRGRGVAARPEAVGVVLGEGSAASFIGGQGGGGVLAGGKLAGELMAVGAGVNGGRARRGDVTPQAGGDRCRRHCAEVAAACTASTAVGGVA